MKRDSQLIGAGGGGKGGAQGARPAQEVPDSLKSRSMIRWVDLLGEGEMEGFVYLDSSNNRYVVSDTLYSKGTASQSGTTITGVSTLWIAEFNLLQFIFADGTTRTITAVTDYNTIEVAETGTVSGQSYVIRNQNQIQRSIYFNETPLKNADGTENFEQPNVNHALGGAAQQALPLAEAVENLVSVGGTVRADGSGVSHTVGSGFDELYVAVRVDAFFSQDKSNGDINGTLVDYTIHFNVDGNGEGADIASIGGRIEGKTRSFYVRTHKIMLPTYTTNIVIRVVRVTADAADLSVNNAIKFDSITEITRVKLTYPRSAIVAMSGDSEQFTRVPERGYRMRLTRIQVPTNYYQKFLYETGTLTIDDGGGGTGNIVTGTGTTFTADMVGMTIKLADYTTWTIASYVSPTSMTITGTALKADGVYEITESRHYATVGAGTSGGVWDGTFKTAWTDNPAWIFYDLLTDDIYGLGGRITDVSKIDKWGLYNIAQHCDTLVDDGFGGLEPRFTCNTYLQHQQEAYDLVKSIGSVFRGMVYWGAGSITPVQDRAGRTPVFNFSPANVIDGKFTYSGTARRARHTVAHIAYNDPNDFYRKKVEYVEDQAGIALLGVNILEVTAFGCTSRGQAVRTGRWALLSELNENDTVRFTVGLDAAFLRPGMLVNITDPLRVTGRYGGRFVAATTTAFTLDAKVWIDNAKTYTLHVLDPSDDLTADANDPLVDTLKNLMLSKAVTVPAGTVTTAGGTALVGVGTAFLTDFSIGDKILVSGEGERFVSAIADNTNLTVGTAFVTTAGTLTYARESDTIATAAFSTAPLVGSMWLLEPSDVAPTEYKVLALKEKGTTGYEVLALEHYEAKYAASETGGLDIVATGTPTLPNAYVIAAPTGIAIESETMVIGHEVVRRLNVSWTETSDRFFSNYVVELSYNDGNWEVVDSPKVANASFIVHAAALYSIRVKAINNINAHSPYLTGSYTLTSNILTAASITGLELEGQAHNLSFEGRDPKFVWRLNSPDTTQEFIDSAVGTRNPLIKGYLVQVIRPINIPLGRLTETLVREVEVPNPEFTYTREQNRADNGGVAIREFTVKVAAVDTADQVSASDEITVTNPAPLLGGAPPTHDSSKIRISTAGGRLVINYDVPTDPDFEGVCVWVSTNPAFALTDVRVSNDYLPKGDAMVPYDPSDDSGMLAYQGPDQLISIDLQATPYYIIVAPYDGFGLAGINYYGPISQTVVVAVDTIAPVTPANVALTTRSEFDADGKERVYIDATFDPNTEADLDHYGWSFREVTGSTPDYTDFFDMYNGVTQLREPTYGTLAARDENSGYIQNTANKVTLTLEAKANTGYELRFQAVDSSGNASAFTTLAANIYQLSATDATVPGKITDLAVAASFKHMFLTWTNIADADYLETEIYANVGGGTPTPPTDFVGKVKGDSWVLSGLATGDVRYFWVRSVDTSGNPGALSAREGPITAGTVHGEDDVAVNTIVADRFYSALAFVSNLNIITGGVIRAGATDYVDGDGFFVDDTQMRIGDEVQSAVDWNGSTQYGSVPHHADLLFTDAEDITLEAWANVDSVAAGDRTIIGKGRIGVSTVNYVLRFDGDEVSFYYRNVANTAWNLWKTTAANLSADTWYHIAVVYTFGTGSSLVCYVDGVATAGSWTMGTGDDAPSIATDALWVGATDPAPLSGPEELWDGTLDEVRIWRTARTAVQIVQFMNQWVDPSDPTLMAYWRFNEGTGSTVADEITGATWSSTTAYVVDQRVLVSSVVYRCILAHTNFTPPNATYWEVVVAHDMTLVGSPTWVDAAPEMSFGQHMRWDGNELIIQGRFKATQGYIAGMILADHKMYSGAGTYFNADTPLYIGADGSISMGDKLKYDPVTGKLTIVGAIDAASYEQVRNTIVYTAEDSLDGTFEMEIPFRVVAEVVASTGIQEIKLSFRILPYRAYSTGAAAGGGAATGAATVTVDSGGAGTSGGTGGSTGWESTDPFTKTDGAGGHSHGMKSGTDSGGGGSTSSDDGTGYHTHTVSAHTHGLPDTTGVSDHSHDIDRHSHTVNSHTHSTPAHTHTTPAHSHTTTSHSHTIEYGIHEEPAGSPTVNYATNDDPGTDPWSAWSSGYTTDQEDIDVLGGYTQSSGWKSLKFKSDANTRLAVIIQLKLDITA